MRGELETAFRGYAVVCCECAVVWWCCGEFHRFAEVVAAAATVVAGVAGDAGFQDDSVADFEVDGGSG
jgi:hypothetical protein